MKVLFVNRMAAIERGGGETFDLQIAAELQRTGHEVSFLSGNPAFGRMRAGGRWQRTSSHHQQQSSPFSWHYVRSPYLGWFPWDRVRGGWRLRCLEFRVFEWLAVRWLMQHGNEYDIIQICELPYVVAKLKKQGFPKPLIMRLTSPDYEDYDQGVKKADGVIASGTSIATVLKRNRPDAVNVPNCVSADHFRPQETQFRKQHNIDDDELMLLYVARLQDFKDHTTLVRAFRQIVDVGKAARLVFAGSGHMTGFIRALAVELGVESRVSMLGEVAYEDLPAVYAAADIMVIPSVYESFCFAALEAMAAELPVITANNGWVPQLLGREGVEEAVLLPGYRELSTDCFTLDGGIVVPKRRPDRLCDAVLQLSANPELRRRMGRRNRRVVVEEYQWKQSAEKLSALYHSLYGDH